MIRSAPVGARRIVSPMVIMWHAVSSLTQVVVVVVVTSMYMSKDQDQDQDQDQLETHPRSFVISQTHSMVDRCNFAFAWF